MVAEPKSYFAPYAWVDGAWAKDVLLSVGADGVWCQVQAHVPPVSREVAIALPGPVIPGLVNAHSHAFQRAIVGLTECRGMRDNGGGDDDFWSWRDRMYSAANRITPAQMEAIATQLYGEMLRGGYTHVCEFHYLHNGMGGAPYADPLEMSLALVRAAHTAGIGLTLLPTLYMRSGFGAAGLRDDQRRFASTPESILRIVEGLSDKTRANALTSDESGLINVGVAIHSLRAADAGLLNALANAANAQSLPVHIHIAEQTQEIADCITHTGQRPIEWLLNHADVNARWNLVHATHTTPGELDAVKRSGAAIVICPSTEANLGDGVFDFPGFSGLQGHWSIGSDSHVTRSWPEELRLLEYSQRLTLRKRNIAAQAGGTASTASALFEAALAGGRAATSQPVGGIKVGNRADFLLLDADSSPLLGVPQPQLLDALVFSSPGADFSAVFVAGRQVTQSTAMCAQVADNFKRVMQQLWA